MPSVLFYVHDPMCSWCWAFRPVWDEVRAALPRNVRVQNVLGGLAPDTDAPMAEAMQANIQAIWRTIQEKVPGTCFNFDFWRLCAPRRATYPACRAVIAAARQGDRFEEAMILAIQRAYYLRAMNPSDADTLVRLAGEIGLEAERFRRDLQSEETRAELKRQIELSRALGAQGFPSLILQHGREERFHIDVDYNDADRVLAAIMCNMES